MKLLVDQNLPSKILEQLLGSFPGSAHVKNLSLERSDDLTIWHYARDNDFSILTKDMDFFELSMMMDSPPKIVWIKTGNISNDKLEVLIRTNIGLIQDFITSSKEFCLQIYA